MLNAPNFKAWSTGTCRKATEFHQFHQRCDLKIIYKKNLQKTTAQTVSRHCLTKFIANEDSQQIMASHSTDGCKAPYLHGVETLGDFCHHQRGCKSFTKQTEISVNSHSVILFMKVNVKKFIYNPKRLKFVFFVGFQSKCITK